MESKSSDSPGVSRTLAKEIYFPTQIYFTDLPGADALNAQLDEHILAWRARDPDGVTRSNVRAAGAWHSSIDMHTRKEYLDLTRQIVVALQQVYDDLGYDPAYEPVCDSMWANVSPRHGFNRHHTHPNVLWSGVYYVRAPRGCGRIYFTDPRAQALALTPRYRPGVQRKPEVWSEVYFEPTEGRLILFPAWLSHQVEPNLAAEEGNGGNRISVSFNFFQRRRSGEP